MAEGDPTFSVEPTAATIGQACIDFATKAWNRSPSEEEVTACSQVAMVDTAMIPENTIRWAHTFASILTASGFIAY